MIIILRHLRDSGEGEGEGTPQSTNQDVRRDGREISSQGFCRISANSVKREEEKDIYRVQSTNN